MTMSAQEYANSKVEIDVIHFCGPNEEDVLNILGASQVYEII